MVVTTIEEYGTRCLLQLAQEGDLSSLSATDIAKREGISSEYTRKIMHIFKTKGLVTSTRGKSGGFQLSKPAKEITIQMVLSSLRDENKRVIDNCEKDCATNKNCIHNKECSLRPVWSFISNYCDTFFNSITLKDMLKSENESANFIKNLSSKVMTT